jgi:putative transposase
VRRFCAGAGGAPLRTRSLAREMARLPRLQIQDGYYHVTARGARQLPLFFDEIDYTRGLSILRKTVELFGWKCHGYAFLPNHYHLFVQTPEPNISAGMQYLNHRYAVRFNIRHGLAGHAFDRRFHSVDVVREPHFLEVGRYIALNPVRAGLCAAPGEWPWSSYTATVGAVVPPDYLTVDFVRSLFSDVEGIGGAAFATFVMAGLEEAALAGSGHVLVPGTETWLDQPTPYTPAKRSARIRTSSAAGRPTTFR